MGKQKKPTMAEQADRHVLYQESVQAPDSDVEFFIETYRALRGREAVNMREDFCGTALLSVEWCKTDPKRTAVGVDLDKPTLEWGTQHNIVPAGMADRIRLVEGNVLDEPDEKVDLTCALNFSYCCFKTRDQLRAYFENARRGLKQDGILVLDLLGGTETMDELEEEREGDEDENYTYIWDQAKFNPINHDMTCHIHFEFDDGSRIDKAFTYEWRLWMIPEISELLKEAGFSKVRVYWEEFVDSEDDDEEMEGTGIYHDVTEAEQQESWVNYIVAEY
ncbi:MAG: class I SAM-dependent methyltransferase [Gammaproteobacteria bacterium]|nr:class I SAM-dependent methyltransferase [Gammaproteobacteria bacterium]